MENYVCNTDINRQAVNLGCVPLVGQSVITESNIEVQLWQGNCLQPVLIEFLYLGNDLMIVLTANYASVKFLSGG